MKNETDLTNYPNFKDFVKRKDKYILDKDRNVIPADLLEWGEFLENTHDERIVNRTELNGLRVSTVFLGLDHGYPQWSGHTENYKPKIFETMIFNGENPLDYCVRYSTWKEAEEGHQMAIQWVIDGCIETDEEEDDL